MQVVLSASDTDVFGFFFFPLSLQKIDTTTSQEITSSEMKQAAHLPQDVVKKVVQETVVIEERHGPSVQASGDPAKAAGLALDTVTAVVKGKDGSAETEGAKEDKREEAQKALTKQGVVTDAASSCEQVEEHSMTVHLPGSLERKSHFEVTH